MLHSLTTSIFSSSKGGLVGNLPTDKKPDESQKKSEEAQKKPAVDTKPTSIFGGTSSSFTSAFTGALGKPLNVKP